MTTGVRCIDFVAQATNLLDGALSEADVALLLAHTEECAGCAEHLAQLRITISLLSHLRREGS